MVVAGLVALAVIAHHVAVAVAMPLDHSLNFIEQASADVSNVFDIKSFKTLLCLVVFFKSILNIISFS